MTLTTLGLEEEFFVLYEGRPSTASLLDLAKLMWRDPRRNFTGTATNFNRRLRDMMSTIEVSTRVHLTPQSLLAEALERRAELAHVMPRGLFAPIGMLPEDNPYNTAGLHLHVGVEDHRVARVYGNLVRFLPVLVLASASSPWRGPQRYGQSYRVHASFALGPLRDDPLHRFQDLIITRRLGTIEIRALDPVWDPARLASIVNAVAAVAALDRSLPHAVQTYNALRETFPRDGVTPTLRDLARELHDLSGFDTDLVEYTEADRLADLADAEGFDAVWRSLDGGVRDGCFSPSLTRHDRPAAWRGAAGLALYYAPRLPYMAVKGWQEHHASPPGTHGRLRRNV